MPLTVWKYGWDLDPPNDEMLCDMPQGTQILCAREQGEKSLCIWARVDPAQPMEKRRFVLCGTGHPASGGSYVGTAMLFGGSLVLHVFEEP